MLAINKTCPINNQSIELGDAPKISVTCQLVRSHLLTNDIGRLYQKIQQVEKNSNNKIMFVPKHTQVS